MIKPCLFGKIIATAITQHARKETNKNMRFCKAKSSHNDPFFRLELQKTHSTPFGAVFSSSGFQTLNSLK